MKRLSKIEKLDQQFPGLADKVRVWFNLGLSAPKVADLLRAQYAVSVPRTTIGYFRATRWVRERQLKQQEQIAAQAAQQIAAERAMKASHASALAERNGPSGPLAL